MASQTNRLMWESPFQALPECRDQVVVDSILLETVRWMKGFGELLSPQTSHVSFTVISTLFYFDHLVCLEQRGEQESITKIRNFLLKMENQ